MLFDVNVVYTLWIRTHIKPHSPYNCHPIPNHSPGKTSNGRPGPGCHSSEISWHMAHLWWKVCQRRTLWKYTEKNRADTGIPRTEKIKNHDVLICTVKQRLLFRIIICNLLGLLGSEWFHIELSKKTSPNPNTKKSNNQSLTVWVTWCI